MSGPYRKPQADIYTVLLAVALAAVLLATIFAYLETSDYGDQKYRGAPPAPVAAVVHVGNSESFQRPAMGRLDRGDAAARVAWFSEPSLG